ncbi:MAG: RidA family protein [Planctomycetota bacterium]|nr:RidA family protein [Planctomycetota bacterium]
MRTRLILALALLVFLTSSLLAAENDGSQVVSSTVPLLHTRQVLSPDEDATAAVREVIGIVGTAGGINTLILKANVVAATQEIADKARTTISNELARRGGPRMTFVVGALPHGRKIGIDVIAVSKGRTPVETSLGRTLPPGPRVYISGQAEKGASPAEAAAKTIASLLKTLHFVGADKSDAVQAKCFLSPMSAASDVVAEFDKVFGKEKLPLVFVEWKSDLPIEIELIAAAPPAAPDAPPIEFLTPPDVKPSPLFARVVRINRGQLIYTSGLYAEEPGTGEAQVLAIFNRLKREMTTVQSDMHHLAKATYYVSDDDASRQLNVLRPKFYDPARPPAASKAMVSGVGMRDRSISIDMIGVVAEEKPGARSPQPE